MSPPDRNSTIFQRCDLTAARPYSRREYAGKFAWRAIGIVLFRLSLPRAFRWRAIILRWFGATIGAATLIHRTTRIYHPWLLTVGEWTNLGPDVVVYNLGPVRIGSHTVISEGAWLCNGSHDYTLPNLPLLRPTSEIGSGVWIAMQAFIGPGVNIGDNCVVGARSVVMKDLPADIVAAGNPARVLKLREMKQQPGAKQ